MLLQLDIKDLAKYIFRQFYEFFLRQSKYGRNLQSLSWDDLEGLILKLYIYSKTGEKRYGSKWKKLHQFVKSGTFYWYKCFEICYFFKFEFEGKPFILISIKLLRWAVENLCQNFIISEKWSMFCSSSDRFYFAYTVKIWTSQFLSISFTIQDMIEMKLKILTETTVFFRLLHTNKKQFNWFWDSQFFSSVSYLPKYFQCFLSISQKLVEI